MSPLVLNYARGAWHPLSEQASVDEALAQLAPGAFGVVTDPAGLPAGLVRAEDLKLARGRGARTLADGRADWPATAIVGSQVGMGELLDSEAGTLLLEGESCGAIVVGDGNQVAGVLTVDTLQAYLAGPGRGLAVNVRGRGTSAVAAADAGLNGSRTTPATLYVCRTCGHRNVVAFYESAHPPQCANVALPTGPHPLAR